MKQNFTKEQESLLQKEYTSADCDEGRHAAVVKLAESMGKSTSSIIGKLSSMGIYQKKVKQDKRGEPVTSKNELVKAIRIFSGARDHELASLEKASKADLKVLVEIFRDMQNRFELR
jgi:hypothetical protein